MCFIRIHMEVLLNNENTVFFYFTILTHISHTSDLFLTIFFLLTLAERHSMVLGLRFLWAVSYHLTEQKRTYTSAMVWNCLKLPWQSGNVWTDIDSLQLSRFLQLSLLAMVCVVLALVSNSSCYYFRHVELFYLYFRVFFAKIWLVCVTVVIGIYQNSDRAFLHLNNVILVCVIKNTNFWFKNCTLQTKHTDSKLYTAHDKISTTHWKLQNTNFKVPTSYF